MLRVELEVELAQPVMKGQTSKGTKSCTGRFISTAGAISRSTSAEAEELLEGTTAK